MSDRRRHRGGLAVAERLGARAVATLDLRDFAPVELRGTPELWPRDLEG